MMPQHPYFYEGEFHSSAHLDSYTMVTLPNYHWEKLYRLLDAHYRQGHDLNQHNWNGAVAVLEDGWPRITHQFGSYDMASFHASSMASESETVYAYALIDVFGIDGRPDIDEDGIEDERCNSHPDRPTCTLEDFA